MYGGQQNGKTSMLLRLEDQLKSHRDDRVRVCFVDFQILPRATSNNVYRYLARTVSKNLSQAPQLPNAPDASEFSDFLEEALAREDVKRLIFLLDELGALPNATRKDLASLLCALHTRRLNSPALAKAQFVIAGGIELHQLVASEVPALRRACRNEYLSDLGEEESISLVADGLISIGMQSPMAAMLGYDIFERVNGHPYFTQRLAEMIADLYLTGDQPDEAAVDELTWGLLEQDDPLLEHLRRSIFELKMEEEVRRLLSGSQRARSRYGINRLALIGLSRSVDRFWLPRNPLLGVALAEWLGLSVPADKSILEAAEFVRGTLLG